MKSAIFGVSVLGGLALASSALAAETDTGGETRGNERRVPPEYGMQNAISVLGNLGFRYAAGSGVGLSARYQRIVVPNGFMTLTSIFDEFGIEGGVDYTHYSFGILGYDWSYDELAFSATAVWNVWFTKQFAAYPRVGLGVAFGSWSDDLGLSDPSGYGGLYAIAGAGVLYEFGAVKLRGELTNTTVSGGVAISLF
jgi:hypothetical protein